VAKIFRHAAMLAAALSAFAPPAARAEPDTAQQTTASPSKPPPVPITVPGATRAVPGTHDCASFYPAYSARVFETGDVIVQYDVAIDGSMRNVGVARPSGSPRLDDAAVTCVREGWRNTPAMVNGAAVLSPNHRAMIRFIIRAPVTAEEFVLRGTGRDGKHDYAGAIADFTAAIGLDPKNADAYDRRSDAYKALGDTTHAAEDRAKANELYGKKWWQ
jgi:TonB family protein